VSFANGANKKAGQKGPQKTLRKLVATMQLLLLCGWISDLPFNLESMGASIECAKLTTLEPISFFYKFT
jgi:hypothetical protein